MITHWLALAPMVVCFFKKEYDNVIALTCVLTTSINYWRRPEKGIRRNIDIICVFTVGAYNMYKNPLYWGPLKLVCFCIWIISNKKQNRRIHSLLHLVSCFAYIYPHLTFNKIMVVKHADAKHVTAKNLLTLGQSVTVTTLGRISG
jgi:hypothetical protein